MYVITNRQINLSKRGLNKFSNQVNAKGPNELRVLEISKQSGRWNVELFDDEMMLGSGAKARKVYASAVVAERLRQKIRRSCRDVLLFVHGYNTNVEEALETALKLQRTYKLEVILFTWPANGGGSLHGKVSYKSDKRDALASIGALNSVIAKMKIYLDEFRKKDFDAALRSAYKRFPDSEDKQNEFANQAIHEACPYKISLLLHSMGNYLFKHMMLSSVYVGNDLLFDNVILAAADTNNKDHTLWVDKIQRRNRVYITINENDYALRLSRMKGGEEQLARLGHYPYQLSSQQTVYVDFTSAKYVDKAHNYFLGDPIQNNNVKRFFATVLTGGTVDEKLYYDASNNLHYIE